MLPSLGFQEILLIGILALVVIGPKDLPLMLRKVGRWTARLRGMAQEFRTGFDELARQAELDELKREVEALRRTTNLNSLANEITKPLATLEDYAGLGKALAPASAVAEEEVGKGESNAQAPEQLHAPHSAPPSPHGGGGEQAPHDEPLARSAP
jgi:sec-independent protein translocase protein TatB